MRRKNLSPGNLAERQLVLGIQRSRVAREEAEQAMTPAERLTLALELSDLCAELAAAGQRALEERS
jgi:hypothetical protein